MNAFARHFRLLRAFVAHDERQPATPVTLGMSRADERKLRTELSALIERDSLADVVHALARCAHDRSVVAHDPALEQAWRRAALHLTDVAERVGAMPDPL
jgi:hypothetical protein